MEEGEEPCFYEGDTVELVMVAVIIKGWEDKEGISERNIFLGMEASTRMSVIPKNCRGMVEEAPWLSPAPTCLVVGCLLQQLILFLAGD